MSYHRVSPEDYEGDPWFQDDRTGMFFQFLGSSRRALRESMERARRRLGAMLAPPADVGDEQQADRGTPN